MVKKKTLFLLLLVTSLFLIGGCLEKKECETSYDCMKRECRTAQCIEGECAYNIIPNCCGNMNCEANVRENKCTCSKDCGECEGRETFKEKGTNREVETEYLSYMCKHNECVLDVPVSEIEFKEKDFTPKDIHGHFTIGVSSSFEQPFDVFKSVFNVKVELQDADEKAVLPINFTRIVVKDKQYTLGKKEIDKKLNQIGDKFEEELNLLKGTDILEETKYVVLKIEYYYSVLEKTGTDEEGNPIYTATKPEWGSIEHSFGEKLAFVNPRAER